MYAEIIVPLHLPTNYTWKIPDYLISQAQIGVRAEVELRNKKYTGIIKNISTEAPTEFTPKDIISILDEQPIIYEQQLVLWKWIAQYYMCSQGDVMQAALPANLKLNSESVLVFNEEYGDNFTHLANDEYILAEALHIKKELKLSEAQKILDSKKIFKVVRELVNQNVCFIWESLKEKYVEKKEQYVILNPTYDDETQLNNLLNNWSKAPKQLELLMSYLYYLQTEGIVTKKNILEKSNATDAQLKGLVEKNVLQIETRAASRLQNLPIKNSIDFELSDAQKNALQAINNCFNQKKVCLLHGITGSGKTQIYIHLLSEIIKKGKQALYLLPEIALTAQLIKRLQQHFGGNIAVYHSKFNDNERVELWNNVKNGITKIVIGARSAFLLPYKNLDLIIVDEEHESNFKQNEPTPRYNAKDAAIYYAISNQINIVLGSATPSIESFTNAKENKYGLVTLTERFGAGTLPKVEIVDMKLFPNIQKEKTIIAPPLHAAITACLNNGKQIILFKNRRGYTPYRVCSACGWIPECKHCNISLTYHKYKNQLVCHFCSKEYALVNTCVACGNPHFEAKNFGTEKIEEAVIDLFPKAKIGRMDMDTVKGKNAHSQLIQQFEIGKLDILIGTQMIVKGLDFENVQLVGILDADSMLNFADFRVNERAFQLMEQVSGRAGRKDNKGLVVIQTLNTKHPLLQLIQQHDYNSFYTNEIDARKLFFYPPFSRLIHIQFKNKNQDVVQKAAHFFAKNIAAQLQPFIIGPAEPTVNRLRNMYLMDLLFKLPKQTQTINACKLAIQQTIAIMYNTKEFNNTIIIPNIDPI